jgi:uncharacterized protein (PEP-CTERM system associated)
MKQERFFFFEKKKQKTFGCLVPLFMAGPALAQADLGGMASVPALPGPADTVLPRSGVDATASDLREHLLNAFGDTAQPSAGGPLPPELQITGQVGLSEEYTDNAGAASGFGRNAGDDVITSLSPVINVVDTSQRLQVNLTYRPIGQLYARNSNYSQIQEQFSGNGTATVLPGFLFMDARAAVSQQSVYGGLGPTATVTLAPNDRQTTSSFSVSPYVSRTLGGAGSVQAGLGYTYSATQAPGQSAAALPASSLNTYGSSFLGTERGFASYTTGEDLGRLQNKVGTDDSLYSGSGALEGARRILLTDDVSYAVTRVFTVLGEAGWEDLDYPHGGYRYSGAIGSGGVQVTPLAGSKATIEYRYVDGFGSAYVQGSVQVSPRIRVFGGYSEGISTFQQDVPNTLLDGTNDVTGAAASGLQASPLLQSSNFFGADQNLNRLDRLDASASYIGNWDTVTLSLQRETTRPVGRTTGQTEQASTPLSTSGIFGSVSERHDLTPTLSLSVFVQYGTNSTGVAEQGSGQTLSVSASVEKAFNDRLSGFLRFGGSYLVGGSEEAALGTQGYRPDQTNVTAGVIRKF